MWAFQKGNEEADAEREGALERQWSLTSSKGVAVAGQDDTPSSMVRSLEPLQQGVASAPAPAPPAAQELPPEVAAAAAEAAGLEAAESREQPASQAKEARPATGSLLQASPEEEVEQQLLQASKEPTAAAMLPPSAATNLLSEAPLELPEPAAAVQVQDAGAISVLPLAPTAEEPTASPPATTHRRRTSQLGGLRTTRRGKSFVKTTAAAPGPAAAASAVAAAPGEGQQQLQGEDILAELEAQRARHHEQVGVNGGLGQAQGRLCLRGAQAMPTRCALESTPPCYVCLPAAAAGGPGEAGAGRAGHSHREALQGEETAEQLQLYPLPAGRVVTCMLGGGMAALHLRLCHALPAPQLTAPTTAMLVWVPICLPACLSCRTSRASASGLRSSWRRLQGSGTA